MVDPRRDDPQVTRTDHEGFDPPGEALHPVLTVVHHPDPEVVGRRLVLKAGEAFVFGRGGSGFGPGGLDDAWISRRHARVVWDGAHVRVADLGSHNGTWIDGATVTSGLLAEGAVLGVGSVLMVLRFGPAALGGPHPRMIGVGAAAARLHEQIQRVAPVDVTVMVSGETGTGKELVARALHEDSGRRGQLVSLNCGAVAEGIVHSELFGHVRGSFSSAERGRAGLVERAAGGTLFLDEIGDATPALQVSLLRLLENREYRPVGSDESRRTDARFVVATHVDLSVAVREGRFREDLYARLHRWVIEVPPLRERREDILPLARHFAEQAAGRPVQIGRKLAIALLRAPWPRNVREVAAVIEQATLEWDGEGELELTRLVADRLGTELRETPPPPRRQRDEKPDAVRLRLMLEEAGGNVRKVAEALGIGRNTLYRWLGEAGIDLADVRDR